MPMHRNVSVVASVGSVVDNIRQQRQDSIKTLESNSAALSQWLAEAITAYTQKASNCPKVSHPKVSPAATGVQTLLDDAVIQEIDSLKVADLRTRLKQRGLGYAGRKAELRERLLESMREELSMEKQRKPKSQNAAKEAFQMKAAAMEKKADPTQYIEEASKRQVVAEPNISPKPSVSSSNPSSASGEAMEVDEPESVPAPPKQTAGFKSPPPTKPTQSKVKSAIKLFSAKSSNNLGIQTLPSKAAAGDENSKPLGHTASKPSATKVHKKQASTKSAQLSDHNGESASSKRPLPGLSSYKKHASSTSVTSNGKSVLKSQSVKDKTEARKARLESIRGASKPVSVSKFPPGTSLSSIRIGGSANKLGAQASSKSRLLNQMREKTLANNKPCHPAFPSKHAAVKPSSQKTHRSPTSTKSPSLNAQSKSAVPPLSPLDTYEISDHEAGSDSESDSEDEKPNKRIPTWALRANLVPALERQLDNDALQDPDEIFGEVQTCNLEQIFDRRKSRYIKRTSSGNWAQDRVTIAEKLTYKRTMGYAQQA